MKNILCLILSLILLSGACISAHAQVTDDELFDEFISFCEEEMNITYTPSNPESYRINIYDRNDVGGVTYFLGDCQLWILNMGYSEFIGGWYFESPVIMPPNGFGLFVRTNEGIWGLKEAYEEGVITDLSPTLSLKDRFYFTIIENGDANGDYVVDIKDATVIQKYLVGLETDLVDKYKRDEILDTDRDGNITVRDATAIQKRIAGLDIKY